MEITDKDYFNEMNFNEDPKCDVVRFDYAPCGSYVVKESIFVNTGESAIYIYDIVPLYGDKNDIVRCKESSLDFECHDLSYEKYFTESVGNGLPTRRGKLYNFYMFYGNPVAHGDLDKDLMKEYNDHTIPPVYMEHIWKAIKCGIESMLFLEIKPTKKS